MKRVCFFDENPNINSGSYRIWVKDLCDSLNEAGIKSRICNSLIELESAEEEIIIFSKSSYSLLDSLKKNSEKTIGIINPSADSKVDTDFVIVGSHEERISLSHYKNVFLYPLIERKFMNLPRKIHDDDSVFKICFHGHYPHLFKFTPHLRDAIEEVSKLKEVEVHIVTGEKDLSWWDRSHGRPDVKVINHTYDKISEVISACDLGVVPNALDMSHFKPELNKITHTTLGLYETDYILRLKNKTNPGRAYVFYQHGIPVVHDMSPSSFEMMAQVEIYDVAHNKNSWISCIEKYTDKNYRQKVSDKFRKVFEEKYDPIEWAKTLHKNIEEIKNE